MLTEGGHAAGVQVDGTTYIKYVRDNKTPDANTATDACLSDDQIFHVIYAYGQLTESATHVPDSSLEILDPAEISNKDFYKEDVLKFHGGGIGVQYDGRGTLSTSANLFEEEGAAGGACTPSTQDGFTCSVERLGGSVIVHYNPVAAGGAHPSPEPLLFPAPTLCALRLCAAVAARCTVCQAVE